MSLTKNFCSSPWIHMRITNSGRYEYCRWARDDSQQNIQSQTVKEYFQTTMSDIRRQFLAGDVPKGCAECKQMEQHGKISGRQRQLLKVGIRDPYFEKTFISSPLLKDFEYSLEHEGRTTRTPIDWQIDLGNYCNGACVFCTPYSSSRLATEFKRIGLTDQTYHNWVDDPALVDQFVRELVSAPSPAYIHFIGGETLITPAFKKLLLGLIAQGSADQITIGFTTNLTVWDDDIVELLKQFKQVNVGLSVETLTPVNDYVRYPSTVDTVKTILNQWVELSRQQGWLTQLRVTPSCLTIHELTTVYDYAWDNNLAVESCNFLTSPEFLKITVLPLEQRQQIRNQIRQWIDYHPVESVDTVINTRDPNRARDQIIQDAQSYVNYLATAESTGQDLPQLVEYLKRLEASRGNSILDYIPEYETIFRSAGY